MNDMSKENIKRLFERQILELTKQTISRQTEIFDYQLSGGWIR